MKALILAGAGPGHATAAAVATALEEALGSRGYQARREDLTRASVPDCRGDFGCWVVTPGQCVQPGPHRDLAREVIGSHLLAVVTPLSFGGYASPVKRVLDHLIPLISPFFATVERETHHEPRYPRFPDLLAIGLLERPDARAEAVFARVVERNALNMRVRRFASAVVAGTDPGAAPGPVARAVEALERSQPPRVAVPPLDLAPLPDLPHRPALRATFLVGSPKGERSTSASLAAHLGRRLAERGVSVSTAVLPSALKADPALGDLAAGLAEADLVVLSAPLYVDGLPGPVTAALEVLASRSPRPGSPAGTRLVALVNCGFPEAVHDDTGLGICRGFAAAVGWDWAGGLAIGGGGMVDARPLGSLGGRVRNLTRALDLAAAALAEGRTIPPEADRLARRPAVPHWLYRLAGDWSFRWQARRHGVGDRLRDRPYPAAE